MKNVFCLFISLILCFSLCACQSSGLASGEVHLSTKYANLMSNKDVETFNEYIKIYQNAVDDGIMNNDVWVLLEFENELQSVYDQIPSLEYGEDGTPLFFDVNMLQSVILTVDVAKSYKEVLDAAGTTKGYEGLIYLAGELDLGTENELKLYSINELNELILDTISKKLDYVISEYFE